MRLLLGDHHLRLLGLLLLRPDEEFHVREVERLTGVPAPPASRQLRRFVTAGLAKSRKVGNQIRYQADRSCLVYEELASMLRKTVGLADVLRTALQALAGEISAAFIFGSAAQGKEGPYSDIDLMVVGSATFDDIVKATYDTQQKLGRSVNPVIFRPADFRDKLSAGDAFVKRVFNEPKIMILGALDEPGEPAKDRSVEGPHAGPEAAHATAGGGRAKSAGRRKRNH